MDKKIEDLKQYYLNEKPPMEIGEGYADVLNRIEKVDNQKKVIPMYAYAGFAIFLFAIGVGATILFFPNNKTVNAVKAATQNTFKAFFAPSITPIPSPSLESLNKKKSSTTPTPTTTINISPTPTFDNKKAEEKSEEKNESKKDFEQENQEVKGAKDDNVTDSVTPVQSKSENHKKNENSDDDSDNSKRDSSGESNRKERDD